MPFFRHRVSPHTPPELSHRSHSLRPYPLSLRHPWPFSDIDGADPVIQGLSGEEQNDILHAYTRLHQTGILHNDVWPGHVTKHPVDGAPRIFDFDGVEWLGPDEQVRRAAEFKEEMARVPWMIGKDVEGQ
ncbi:hypothetical protein IAR50_000777 [Cryptococcus sp. DSM 104548]